MRTIAIDRDALAHNLARVRAYAPASKVLAMVKANAYGHGLLVVASALKEADGFGVADLSEALQLRQAGFEQLILVMRGFHDAAELALFIEHSLTAVVHHPAQIALLQQTPCAKALGVWVKVDSGMHRLGFNPAELRAAFDQLMLCPWVNKPLCLMTHFADANESNQIVTARQLMVFEQALATFPRDAVFEQSLVNSAGIIYYPEIQSDWVRPGIMLYGASPFSEREASVYGLKPVMTVKTRLISILTVPAGAAVGYGGTFVCPKPMRIGVIAFGYGDGYPRLAPSGTPVLVDGYVVPTVGRVSMDTISVDLTDRPEVEINADVTLWGEGLAIEQVANQVGTIPYELFCHVQRFRLQEL